MGQTVTLETSGLAGFFDVVTTTDIGYGKPQPEIFLHALHELNATPAEAAYVGDSREWDVEGARRASMTSIWLNRKGSGPTDGQPVPNVEIRTLSELPEALRRLP